MSSRSGKFYCTFLSTIKKENPKRSSVIVLKATSIERKFLYNLPHSMVSCIVLLAIIGAKCDILHIYGVIGKKAWSLIGWLKSYWLGKKGDARKVCTGEVQREKWCFFAPWLGIKKANGMWRLRRAEQQRVVYDFYLPNMVLRGCDWAQSRLILCPRARGKITESSRPTQEQKRRTHSTYVRMQFRTFA